MPKDTQKMIKDLKHTNTEVIKSQRKAVREEQGTRIYKTVRKK